MARITDYIPQSFDGGKTFIVRSPSTGDTIYDSAGEYPEKFATYAEAKEDADYQNKSAGGQLWERVTDRFLGR